MGYFPATIEALLRKQVVRAARLLHLDFLTAPAWLWEGAGPLTTLDGRVWSGLGEFISISGIDSAIGGQAPMASLTLSGVSPAVMAATFAAASEVKNRECAVHLQFFDEQWQPLDPPYALWLGVMDTMRAATSGPAQRSVTLTAETVLVNRARPAFGFLSDKDQRALYPGDRFLEQISAMTSKTVNWPVF